MPLVASADCCAQLLMTGVPRVVNPGDLAVVHMRLHLVQPESWSGRLDRLLLQVTLALPAPLSSSPHPGPAYSRTAGPREQFFPGVPDRRKEGHQQHMVWHTGLNQHPFPLSYVKTSFHWHHAHKKMGVCFKSSLLSLYHFAQYLLAANSYCVKKNF